MPLINDDAVYTVTNMIAGATWIGSLPNGQTVQFSIEGLISFVKGEADLLYFNNATKVGQTVVGNADGVAESTVVGINGGDPFFGTLNTFPATNDTHIDFIVKKQSR